MNTRDTYNADARAAMLAIKMANEQKDLNYKRNPNQIARYAFDMADAMQEERFRREAMRAQARTQEDAP